MSWFLWLHIMEELQVIIIIYFTKKYYNIFVSGGHYIAFAKNYKTKRWYEFNDSRVSQVSADIVAETEAYLLFYR